MKKTILRKVAFNLLLLAGLVCLSHSSVSAQSNASSSTALMQEPKGPFVESHIALALLATQIGEMKSEITVLEPGTTEYDLVEWKYAYYNEVHDRISGGATVSQSIVKALDMYTENPAYTRVPESQRIANKNAVVLLLKV